MADSKSIQKVWLISNDGATIEVGTFTKRKTALHHPHSTQRSLLTLSLSL